MSTIQYQAPAQRFYWVDALRGVAALSIVVFHYHHFYLADSGDRGAIPSVETFPYADVFVQLYSPFAAKAVELFWLISGFVFAHVYLPRPVSAWAFGVARFARLYPLHLATLLYVAVLQVVSLNVAGHWQIYANNDIKHFVLQLFMSSNWITWSRGLSFNGPIWSVSLEIIVYGMFFFSVFVMRRAPMLVAFALSTASWAWVALEPVRLPLIQESVFNCAGYFFLGSLLYTLHPERTLVHCVTLAVLGTMLSVAGAITGTEKMIIAGIAITMLTIAAGLDRTVPTYGVRLRILGDISYSVYLVHVPLQMTALLIADLAFDGTRWFADSYLTLPIYLVTVVGVGLAVHRWFERPVGKAIRMRLLDRT